jgi:hypothetical protein
VSLFSPSGDVEALADGVREQLADQNDDVAHVRGAARKNMICVRPGAIVPARKNFVGSSSSAPPEPNPAAVPRSRRATATLA